MKKAIIFDMDGVILDSHDAWFYMFNQALDNFENKNIDLKEFDECVWAKSFNNVCKKYFTVKTFDVLEFYKKFYPEFKKKIKPMKQAKETLSGLKAKGLSLAIASNTPKQLVLEALTDLDLLTYFDVTLGGDSVKKGKPAPDIIFEALKQLKLKKEQAYFIGDTIWDMMAAEAAEIDFIGFQIDSDTSINNLKQLLELV